MRRLALAAAAIALAACAPARVQHVAVKPAPSVGATPASALSSLCPVYVVDGVETVSTCAAPKKEETLKCDPAAPIFIVDGVLQSAPCVKTD